MISVICPVYNEEHYIIHLMEFFLAAPPVEKELILVDGGSKDKTVAIIEEYAQKYPQIILLHNPDKYVSFALNKAIHAAKGSYIIRLDAHTSYADDYFVQVLKTFEKTGADIVGGPTRTTFKTAFQRAVGYCISTKMGVGDSKVHDDQYEGYTDTVTFGSWRKDLFDTVGYFDVQLMRNQDDEFGYRAKSFGKTLYLNPAIKLWYYPRNTLKGLFKQYYQYGLYKPLVLKKVGSEAKLRHFIPAFFTLYVLSLPLAILFPLWLMPLALYLLLSMLFASRCDGGWMEKIYCIVIYLAVHIAYGSGFLLGLNKKPKLNTTIPTSK